jgi:quercetin 2,3-dioxygenase
MIDVRPFEALGRFDIDWLSARYHFSFADYFDPSRTGWGPLCVWNDDTIRPGGGFPPHPHRDMEIITYVRKGALTHRDNLGNEGRTEAGDIQVMTAGSGIVHSEFNLEPGDTTLFQIWVEPRQHRLSPRWETRRFGGGDHGGGLVPLASGEPRHEGALPIHQDATLFGAMLPGGQSVRHGMGPERRAYLVPARGVVEINGTIIPERAGAAIAGEEALAIRAAEEAEVLLLDLP